MSVFIIADDLTGANDSNVKFAKYGAKAATIYDISSINNSSECKDLDILAYSTESRGMTRKKSYDEVSALLNKLTITADDIIYKKIDSGLRGNIGWEIKAIIDNLPWIKAVLVSPASPENQRITIGGKQLLNGIPADKTEMANDPISPVANSHIPSLLSMQSNYKIGYLSLSKISQNIDNVKKYFNKLIEDGCKIIVSDASKDEHLLTLAELVVSNKGIIPCGTAGLANAIAIKKLASTNHNCNYNNWQFNNSNNRDDKNFLAVIGSKSHISQLQILKLHEYLPQVEIVDLNLSKFSINDSVEDEIANMVSLSIKKLKSKFLILHISQLNKNIDSTKLVLTLGEIVRRIVTVVKIDSMFITGGDTVTSVFKKIDAQAMTVENELDPGICVGTLIGGLSNGAEVITKAGSFGDELTLVKIFKQKINNVNNLGEIL